MNQVNAMAAADQPERRISGFAKLMIFAFAAVLLILLLYGGWHWSLDRQIDQQLAAIAARSEPTSLQELNDYYPQPTGPNAADLYLRAIGMLKKPDEVFAPAEADDSSDAEEFSAESVSGIGASDPPLTEHDPAYWLPLSDSEVDLPELDQPLPPPMLEAIDRYIAANQAVVDLLHREARLDAQARYPIDLTLGFDLVLPEIGQLRAIASMLNQSALAAIERGRVGRALDDLRTGLAVGESLRNEPVLISHLVRIAIVGINMNTVERLLNRAELTDDQLQRLDEMLGQIDIEPGLTRGFCGERAVISGFFVSPADVIETANIPVIGLKLIGLWNLNHSFAIDYMTQMVEATKLPPPKRSAALQTVEDRVESLPLWRYPISRLLLPSLTRAAVIHNRTSAQLRLGSVAVAVERYRLAEGHLPDDLGVLVSDYLPAIPLDPFDGKPLRYVPDSPGYLLYSIGEDGVDNTGQRYDATGEPFQPDTDIVLEVRR